MDNRLNRHMIGWLRARLPDVDLERVTDPRREHRRRWPLGSMLRAVMVGILAGCRSLADVEALTQEMSPSARRALGIRGRLPDTTARTRAGRVSVGRGLDRRQVKRHPELGP